SAHLVDHAEDRGVRHPQPDRGGLPRRRGPRHVGAARPHHRPHRGHAAAPPHLRDDGDRRVRPPARPHLTANPQDRVRMSMRWPVPATVRWSILVLLLVLWEVVPLTGALPELFLPALSKTLAVLWTDRHIYFAALLVTLYEVALSMLIACGLGIL